MGDKISALGAGSAVTGAELFAGVQSSTTKKFTAAQLTTHIVDTLVADTTVTAPATSYNLLAENSGAEIRIDIDALATYCVDKGFTDADDLAAKPLLTDDVLLARSDDSKKCTTAQLAEYVLDGSVAPSATMRGTILNLTTLDADAALAGTELMIVATGSDPNTATLTAVAAFVHAGFDTYLGTLDALTAAGTAIADADTVFVSDNGTGKKIVASELATYMEGKVSAGVVADVWDGDADTPVDTSVFVFETSGDVLKKVTGANLYTYIEGKIYSGADDTQIASGDFLPFFDITGSNAIQRDTVADLAVVVGDYMAATGASAVTPIAGDHVMLHDLTSGGMEKCLVSALNTKMLDGSTDASATLKASIRDISGLTDFGTSIDGDEHMLVGDGSTGKRATLAQVATFAHSDATVGLAKYIDATLTNVDPLLADHEFFAERSAAGVAVTAAVVYDYIVDTLLDEDNSVTTVIAADKFLMERVGTGYQAITASAIYAYVAAAFAASYDPDWDVLDTDDYTSTPADADTITMQDPSLALMAVGLPLKYTIGGTDYFGIVSAVGAGSIDVRGATLATGDITALYVGPPSRVVSKQIKIPGNYLIPWNWPDDGTTSDLLALIGREYIDWQLADAYLVSVSATHRTADGTNPYINVKIGGSAVLTENGNDGFQMGVAGTWVRSSGVGINLSNYGIVSDDAIEVFCTAVAGTDGEASDLSIDLTFVLE